ncbi:MAG: DASS family sodium-coupled anion symporter [Anaerolineales bacterium]|nr:DASS family sodium-coupled anion symporter [Anaerolineales bacterium]
MQPNSAPESFAPPVSFFHSREFILLIVLAVSLVGYLFAPDDLAAGSYKTRVEIRAENAAFQLEAPFEIGTQSGELLTHTETTAAGTIEVQAADSYVNTLGQTIHYKVRLLDASGEPVVITLQDATSTISGQNYEQILPPVEKDGDWLQFSMRIPYKTRIATALMLAVAGLWLTEIIPLAAAAFLVPIVLVVARVSSASAVLAPFAHPIIFLFLAGFLLAQAMRRTGFDRLIALTILSRASSRPASLMLTMMAITAFLSMWMSNTASVAMIIPIALAVIEKIPEAAGKTGFRRALILGVAYAGAIGGIGSAIGTPANILAMTFLSEYSGTDLTFIDWFAYGLPMVLLMVPVIWAFLLLSFKVRSTDVAGYVSPEVYRKEFASLGGLNREQQIVLLVFVLTIALWLSEGWHGISSGIVALIGALILFFSNTLQTEDLNRINWNALLTFGGGLSIGTILVETGFSDWIALKLVGLAALPQLLVIFLVAGMTLLIGAFISNTACAAMLIPLAIPLAQLLHIDPRLMVVVVAIASSIDFALIIGTPPTMLAYSTGLFDTSEIFRRGIVLDLVGVLLLTTVMVWIWNILGVIAW